MNVVGVRSCFEGVVGVRAVLVGVRMCFDRFGGRKKVF